MLLLQIEVNKGKMPYLSASFTLKAKWLQFTQGVEGGGYSLEFEVRYHVLLLLYCVVNFIRETSLWYIGWSYTIRIKLYGVHFMSNIFWIRIWIQIIFGQCTVIQGANILKLWVLQIQNFNVSLPSSSWIFCSTRDHLRRGWFYTLRFFRWHTESSISHANSSEE